MHYFDYSIEIKSWATVLRSRDVSPWTSAVGHHVARIDWSWVVEKTDENPIILMLLTFQKQ